jgi:hypothetical protein
MTVMSANRRIMKRVIVFLQGWDSMATATSLARGFRSGKASEKVRLAMGTWTVGDHIRADQSPDQALRLFR